MSNVKSRIEALEDSLQDHELHVVIKVDAESEVGALSRVGIPEWARAALLEPIDAHI